jgi:hypothetical protein
MTTFSPIELLDAVRRILNDTRQDRICRPFLAKHPGLPLLPFLGSSAPAFFFLGAAPSGYDIAEAPQSAEDYLEWARSYFEVAAHDRGSFASYLPLAANNTGDYAAFGSVSTVAHLVPMATARSSDVTMPVVRACWPRMRSLLQAIQPKLILCHGSLTWKFLAGLENGEQVLTDLPSTHKQPVADFFDTVGADQIPFASSFAGLPGEYRPWIVPLKHLGGAGGSKDVKRKAEQAVLKARRAVSSSEPTTSNGARIRVRRV